MDEMINYLRETHFLLWKEKNYLCCVLRSSEFGHLCGYVGFGKDHPLFGKGGSPTYKGVDSLDVHGGITWADKICPCIHPNVFDKDLWWLGFDCAHLGDISPTSPTQLLFEEPRATYRNFEYVREEVINLVKQLEKIYVKSNSK